MTEAIATHLPPCFQVDRLSQQLQKLEGDLEAAKSAEASARSKAAAEAKQRALAAAEAEAAGANARQEHSQATSRLSASLKKLEVKLYVCCQGFTMCSKRQQDTQQLSRHSQGLHQQERSTHSCKRCHSCLW